MVSETEGRTGGEGEAEAESEEGSPEPRGEDAPEREPTRFDSVMSEPPEQDASPPAQEDEAANTNEQEQGGASGRGGHDHGHSGEHPDHPHHHHRSPAHPRGHSMWNHMKLTDGNTRFGRTMSKVGNTLHGGAMTLKDGAKKLHGGAVQLHGGVKDAISRVRKVVPRRFTKGGDAAGSDDAPNVGTSGEEDEKKPGLKRGGGMQSAADLTFGTQDPQRPAKPGWYAWWYRNISFGRYAPFDEEIQRTDIEYYDPPWYIKYTDKFARRMDRAGDTTPGDLPPTWCGAICSFVFVLLATSLLYNSVNNLFSMQTSLVGWGAIALSVDYICEPLANYDGTGVNEAYKAAIMPNGTIDDWNLEGCAFFPEYFAEFPTPAKPPYMDMPVLIFDWKQRLEFYEEDGHSSLAKIEWREKNGMHFGMTSTQKGVPVAFGAHEKVPILLGSYPHGASEIESPMPNMTRFLREMSVTSSTHNFDESLRYAYSDLGLMGDADEFFDHDAVAFVRFDTKQMRNIKSCQVQVGLVSRYQYDALRPFLLKFNREYQRKNMMDTMVTDNWSWHPSLYTNVESGTWRRRGSQDNLMIMRSGWTAAAARRFMQTVAYGKYQVNIERRMREFGIDTGYNATSGIFDVSGSSLAVPSVMTDWMLFATFVNNFQYSAEAVICDGKSGDFFHQAFVKAEPPGKYDKVLTLKTPVVVWTTPFPFYVTVTGDMGVERMLVTSRVSSTEVRVTRGTAIGAARLNFKTPRPDEYPAVATSGLWVCPDSRYMDGEYCDCNCGMTDPDCLSGTLPVKYCAATEICSALGRCTRPIYNSTGSEVVISEPCASMSMPGEVLLNGYLGHQEDFESQGGAACWTCPYDDLYSGKTSKNENNEYICNYRPEGDIPAKVGALPYDDLTVSTYSFLNTSMTRSEILGAYRIVKVLLGPKAGFPVQTIDQANFTVELNLGQGTNELATAIVSEAPDTKTKTQILHLKATGSAFRYQHFASGTMVSSLNGDYTDTILQLDDDNQPFPVAGPYRILIDSSEMQIRAGSSTVTTTTTASAAAASGSSRRRLLSSDAGYKLAAKRRRLGYGDSAPDDSGSSSWDGDMNSYQNEVSEDSGFHTEEGHRRFLQAMGTSTGNGTRTTCSMLDPKRQRLDISEYPAALEPAGVKSILTRPYTANKHADASIYNYFAPNSEGVANGASAARSLYFDDSSLHMIPGATNCFTDLYATTAFKTSCNVDHRRYSFYVVMQTPPGTESGTLASNITWTATTGGKDAANSDIGFSNDGVKEALREAIGDAFGLAYSGQIKPDMQALTDTTGGSAMDIAAPNPAAPSGYTATTGTRELVLQVTFRTRQWYELNRKMDEAIAAATNHANMSTSASGPFATLLSAFNTKVQTATNLVGVYASTNYDSSGSASINPKNNANEGFRIISCGSLFDNTQAVAAASRLRRRLLEDQFGVEDTSSVRWDQDVVTPDSKTMTLRQLQVVTTSVLNDDGTYKMTTAKATQYDFSVDYTLRVTTVDPAASGGAYTTPEALAASANFKTQALAALVYASTNVNQTRTPAGHANAVTDADLTFSAYGQQDPALPTDTTAAKFRMLFSMSMSNKALSVAFHASSYATEFQTLFASQLQTGLSSILVNTTSMALSYDGALVIVPYMESAPPKTDFNALSGFTAVKKDKPWCDYSKESGAPGIDSDGSVYTSGRASIFCDGLHDGLLVVNYAGFSDPSLIPKVEDEMKIMVRGGSADAANPPTMEVRTMRRAYQWLFPTVDARSGTLNLVDQVTPWRCDAKQWADGICDCNCGRADWDCMGDRGVPELFVKTYLDDVTSTVTVNINCPDGDEALVNVPELDVSAGGTPGQMPPTCGEIKAAPQTYAYCEFKTGLPTSERTRAFSYGTEFNGTLKAAPNYMRYLWEVIELDCPLIQDRDIGTTVETLGVSLTSTEAFHVRAKSQAGEYVDKSLLETNFELDPNEAVEGVSPACLAQDPPPFCTGGAVSLKSGEEIQTLPIVRVRLILDIDPLTGAGTTLVGSDLLANAELTEGFQLAVAATYQVKRYEVRVRSFALASRRMLQAKWRKLMEKKDKEPGLGDEQAQSDEVVFSEIDRIQRIRNEQLLAQSRLNDQEGSFRTSQAAAVSSGSPMAPAARKLSATPAQKLLVEFDVAQSTRDLALALYSVVQTKTGEQIKARLTEQLQEVSSISITLRSVAPAGALTKMPDLKALEKAVREMVRGEKGGKPLPSNQTMTSREKLDLQTLMSDIHGFDMGIFDPELATNSTGASSTYAGQGSSFATCFDECCFKNTVAEMATCADTTWQMTGTACCPDGLERHTFTNATHYAMLFQYATPFDDPFYLEPAKCCVGLTAQSETLEARNTCCKAEVGFAPCCKSDVASRKSRKLAAADSPSGSAEGDQDRSEVQVEGEFVPSREELDETRRYLKKLEAESKGLDFSHAALAHSDDHEEQRRKSAELPTYVSSSRRSDTSTRRLDVGDTAGEGDTSQEEEQSSGTSSPRRKLRSVEDIFEALVGKYPWMHPETAQVGRAQKGRARVPDALTMAERLMQDVFNDPDWHMLMKSNGVTHDNIRRLAQSVPDYTRPLTKKEYAQRVALAGKGNEHRRRLKAAVQAGELSLKIAQGEGGRTRYNDEGFENLDIEARNSRALQTQQSIGQKANVDVFAEGGTRSTISSTTLDGDGSVNAAAVPMTPQKSRGWSKSKVSSGLQTDWAAIEQEWLNRHYSHMMQDPHAAPENDDKNTLSPGRNRQLGRSSMASSDTASSSITSVEQKYNIGNYAVPAQPVAESLEDRRDDLDHEQEASRVYATSKDVLDYRKTEEQLRLMADIVDGLLRRLGKDKVQRMLGQYVDDEDPFFNLAGPGGAVDEYINKFYDDGSGVGSSPSSEAYTRYLSAASNATSNTTANTSNYTGGPNMTFICSQDWSDESLWPPNAKIADIPQCAHGMLTQAQLEQLGFFDQVFQTVVATDIDEAISQFAASVAQLIPAKRVVSFVIQTISMLNLFRDASQQYLPKNRHLPTPSENFKTPASLDAHIAMFVMPKRVKIADLCPNNRVEGERITNFFGTGVDSTNQFWRKMTFHPDDNLKVTNCTVAPFRATHCLSLEEMQTDSVDKYRLFCMKDFLPANTMSYKIEGALTGHWLVAEARENTEYDANRPEYILDMEQVFHMTIDSKFLEVEKDYMGGQQDYSGGSPRLWAAEAMARGRAVCTDVVKGCAEGIPANPPMLLPSITIRVNHKRTEAVVEKVKPKHWPLVGSSQWDLLIEEIDNLDLDISSGLRQLSAAEDGYIAIKPMTIVIMRVVWQVNPIYFVNKWTGGISLTRWATSIKNLDIGFQQADYTMKSRASIRLIFEIDGASIRFQEVPKMSFADFLALLGAFAGYTGLVGSVLGLWQKAVRPFGLVDFYYADNEYANVVDRWYAGKMQSFGFEVPEKSEDGDKDEKEELEDDKEPEIVMPKSEVTMANVGAVVSASQMQKLAEEKLKAALKQDDEAERERKQRERERRKREALAKDPRTKDMLERSGIKTLEPGMSLEEAMNLKDGEGRGRQRKPRGEGEQVEPEPGTPSGSSKGSGRGNGSSNGRAAPGRPNRPGGAKKAQREGIDLSKTLNEVEAAAAEEARLAEEKRQKEREEAERAKQGLFGSLFGGFGGSGPDEAPEPPVTGSRFARAEAGNPNANNRSRSETRGGTLQSQTTGLEDPPSTPGGSNIDESSPPAQPVLAIMDATPTLIASTQVSKPAFADDDGPAAPRRPGKPATARGKRTGADTSNYQAPHPPPSARVPAPPAAAPSRGRSAGGVLSAVPLVGEVTGQAVSADISAFNPNNGNISARIRQPGQPRNRSAPAPPSPKGKPPSPKSIV
ncbi:unnamed protein product [Amoebophrya sp. A25]|nr:unnamed protein product [Amoebophrya sp. A25]|eukprot:GSA25T00004011001.1